MFPRTLLIAVFMCRPICKLKFCECAYEICDFSFSFFSKPYHNQSEITSFTYDLMCCHAYCFILMAWKQLALKFRNADVLYNCVLSVFHSKWLSRSKNEFVAVGSKQYLSGDLINV